MSSDTSRNNHAQRRRRVPEIPRIREWVCLSSRESPCHSVGRCWNFAVTQIVQKFVSRSADSAELQRTKDVVSGATLVSYARRKQVRRYAQNTRAEQWLLSTGRIHSRWWLLRTKKSLKPYPHPSVRSEALPHTRISICTPAEIPRTRARAMYKAVQRRNPRVRCGRKRALGTPFRKNSKE